MTTKTRTMTVLIIMMVINCLLYRIINDNDRSNKGTKRYYNDGNNVDTDGVEKERGDYRS